ncbi:MAG TPA: SpoIIE family protein phosphatase [Bryobacteraceae bacterium]|nr:SpoIIE family protein phosphatase [Bryobacteraceae bacterium]
MTSSNASKPDLANNIDQFIRDQLLDRRHKLEHASCHVDDAGRLRLLLEEVDSALARIDSGSYGICESCHDAIECDRLITDPLVRFCLDHLTRNERSALEKDLELAQRVQMGLLPKENFNRDGWQVCYHYEPAGLVSGDYCDVIDAGEKGFYFMVGDVSGKGVAASMLMTHLHAMFRTLIPVGLSLPCMLQYASRVFRESTLPNQFATLVAGRAWPDGKVEICNAGHPLPLVVREGAVQPLETSDLPIGLFGGEEFTLTELSLYPGHGMVIYSDGVPEATDLSGREYGTDRLRELIGQRQALHASTLLAACRDDLSDFRRNAARTDDVTLFVIGRGQV